MHSVILSNHVSMVPDHVDRHIRNHALEKGLSIFNALKLLPIQLLLHPREQKNLTRGQAWEREGLVD